MPVWFEAGRREIFRFLTPDLSFRRWRVALVNMNVDYLGQLYFQEDAMVRTWVDRIGNKSFTLYEEIWQSRRHCARGSATYVHFNYEAGTAEPVLPECRRALEVPSPDRVRSKL